MKKTREQRMLEAWRELKDLVEFHREVMSGEIKMYIEDSRQSPRERVWGKVDGAIACSRARHCENELLIKRMERLENKYSLNDSNEIEMEK